MAFPETDSIAPNLNLDFGELMSNHLSKYKDALIKNEVFDFYTASLLTENDLEAMGFSLGARKTFLKIIKDYKNNIKCSNIKSPVKSNAFQTQSYFNHFNIFKETANILEKSIDQFKSLLHKQYVLILYIFF